MTDNEKARDAIAQAIRSLSAAQVAMGLLYASTSAGGEVTSQFNHMNDALDTARRNCGNAEMHRREVVDILAGNRPHWNTTKDTRPRHG